MFKLFHETKSIKWLYQHKELIDFSPPYQRLSNVWDRKQKQLLIDSIINHFDIPKFYFQFMPPKYNDRFYNYAIIDGKQRIESFLGFINDDFPLAESFDFWDHESTDTFESIAGKYFSEIELIAPSVIARFWQTEINIVFMDATDPDTINEMFVRLNSGIAVNTAEKRNASGGQLSLEIQKICQYSVFFSEKINISNRRFAHHDLLLKILMLEMGQLLLTKDSVNKFVEEQKDFNINCSDAMKRVTQTLNRFESAFSDKDPLLAKKNVILTLYAIHQNIPIEHLRPFLNYFEKARNNAINASKHNQECDPVLVEFSRLLQQGADKKRSIQRRCEIMLSYYNSFCSHCNPTVQMNLALF